MRSEAKTQIFDKLFKIQVVFYDRWTMGMLAQVEPLLYEALEDQEFMFYDAFANGSDDDCVVHGEALYRGFEFAIYRMEDAEIGNAVALFPGSRIVRVVRKEMLAGTPKAREAAGLPAIGRPDF